LSAGRNLNDPKEKGAFSRQVAPIIRDVADPVERAHYAQRLARLLRVDEHAVLEELGGAALPKARRPARPGESVAERAGALAKSASDLEAHCLAALLQSPSALLQVDDTLAAINLDPLGADDLDNTAHREILTAIRVAGEQGIDVHECLDEMLWSVLTALIAAGTSRPAPTETPDWGREAVQSALRLRERNLKRQQQELDALAREAVEQGQTDAARELGEQGHRCAIVINRLQKARWPGEIARLSTADPWRQS